MQLTAQTRKHVLFTVALFLVSQFGFYGCGHKKVAKPLSRQHLQNKRVALVEVGGPKQSQKHVEVAVVNEIIERGRFQIVDRKTVQNARVAYPTEGDWQRLGKKVGADYVMSIRVLDFSVTEREGYDAIREEDSVLTEESGEDEPIVGVRYQKVKGHEGSVRLAATFFDVEKNALVYKGEGVARESHNSREGNTPRKMQLLERLTHQAIADFFEKLPKE